MADLFQLTTVDPRTGRPVPVPARARVDAILERADARDVVRSLDAQSLYALIHETGTDIAWELLMMASGEQVRAFLDFDCWTRDEFEGERFTSWLEILLQREDPDFVEMLDTVDPEILALWLRERIQVFQWEEDRDLLDAIDAPVLTSPCGQYALALPTEHEDVDAIRLLLERIYATGVENGQRLLEAARWEMTTDMMERAFEHRSARLGDLGFVPFHEAHEVFAWRDPGPWADATRERARAAAEPPLVISEGGRLDPLDVQLQHLEARRFGDAPTAFVRALGALPAVVPPERLDDVVESVLSQFRAVVARAHIADLGNPGDVVAMRAAVERADAYLGIALELVAGDDDALAASALARTPLRDLHQAGFSATARLAREAKRLRDRGNLGLIDGQPLSLLEDDQRELLAGLARRRPALSADGGARFERLAAVEAAARRLARIAFVELAFFGLLRFQRDELAQLVFDPARCATPPEQVTYRVLFATLLADLVADRPRALTPLTRDELRASLAAARAADDPVAELTDAGARLLRAAARGQTTVDSLAAAFASEVAVALEDALGDGLPDPPFEVAQQLFLVAPLGG